MSNPVSVARPKSLSFYLAVVQSNFQCLLFFGSGTQSSFAPFGGFGMKSAVDILWVVNPTFEPMPLKKFLNLSPPLSEAIWGLSKLAPGYGGPSKLALGVDGLPKLLLIPLIALSAKSLINPLAPSETGILSINYFPKFLPISFKASIFISVKKNINISSRLLIFFQKFIYGLLHGLTAY